MGGGELRDSNDHTLKQYGVCFFVFLSKNFNVNWMKEELFMLCVYVWIFFEHICLGLYDD